MNGLDDRIFGKEAGEWRESGVSQRADQHGDVSDRHVFAQATHFSHVLLVMHRHDHRAGTKEKYRFKEGVRHQVENSDRVGRRAKRHGHEAEL